jgi:hypothetical protein
MITNQVAGTLRDKAKCYVHSLFPPFKMSKRIGRCDNVVNCWQAGISRQSIGGDKPASWIRGRTWQLGDRVWAWPEGICNS